MPSYAIKYTGLRGVPSNTILGNNTGSEREAIALSAEDLNAMGVGGNPFNQDLNIADDVAFNDVTANSFIGDGSALTGMPNIFDQDLNEADDVTFATISIDQVKSTELDVNGSTVHNQSLEFFVPYRSNGTTPAENKSGLKLGGFKVFEPRTTNASFMYCFNGLSILAPDSGGTGAVTISPGTATAGYNNSAVSIGNASFSENGANRQARIYGRNGIKFSILGMTDEHLLSNTGLYLKNASTSQEIEIYNTYSDSSNFERAEFKWKSSAFEIATQDLGTGTARDIKINRSDNTAINLTATGITAQGAFSPVSNAVYNLGASNKRWGTIYGTALVGTTGNFSSTVTLSGLPSSDPSTAGQLWNDSGTLKISAG